jgi:hypothetical protein
MPPDYYIRKLYPLQDKVLKILERAEGDFYLSGGTALSRSWLFHRFSDDLDFFFNQYGNFKMAVEQAISLLRREGFQIETAQTESDFARFFVIEENVSLKLEWINDVAFTFGEKNPGPIFSRTDHWQNILSNKLSALSRDESKDIADVISIASHFTFSWQELIYQAKQKDLWVDELEISRILDNFQLDRLQEINWVQEPVMEKLKNQLRQTARDILEGKENQLGNYH